MVKQLSQVNLDLRIFEEKNSPAGRFVRYCNGRIKTAISRQIAILAGSLVLAFLVDWQTGILTLVVALAGEALDIGFLWYIVRRQTKDVASPRNITLSTITSTVQALSIAFCVAISWLNGGAEARFFAMAFLTGTVINAGLITRFHPTAVYTKQSIYIATVLFLFGFDIVSGAWWNKEFAFDAFGTFLFAFMIWVLLAFVIRQDRRRVAYEHDLLQEKHRTDRINLALAENENKARQLALVAQHANDSVIISNPEGKIIWVNETFTRISGFSKQEALGKSPGQLLNGPETNKKTIEKIVNAALTKKPLRVEIENVTKAGKNIWVETSLTPILDDHGDLSIMIGVERDITVAKAKEFELAQAKLAADEAASAKSNFLATMSHEIRTPMNGIIGMADLLSQTKLEPDQKEFVDTIVGSGESLLQIINDILDFSKLDAGKMGIENTPFSLRDTMVAVTNLLVPIAQEKDIKLHLEIAGDVPETLLGDPGRIRQVIVNLIGNAIKFTAKGGVVVRLKCQEQQDQCQVSISITDTGIGIANDKIAKIFDNFSQAEQETSRKFGGTGLGLSIAKLLARKMHGDITVRSVPNVGSKFEFTCLLKNAEAGSHLVKVTDDFASSGTRSFDGARIMVAEDNKTNRLLIEKMLSGLGLELQFAYDGEAAISLFKSMLPDLVFMDVSMPEKDGLQATKEIRRWEKSVGLPRRPIMALTANAFAEDRARCSAAGMDGFLTKPIKKAILIDALAAGIAVGHGGAKSEPALATRQK